MNPRQDEIKTVSRRQFLGHSAHNAASMAAAGVVGMTAVGSVRAATTTERISVGVIGLRNRGKTLANHLAAFADVDVTAVCDVDAGVLHSTSRAINETTGKSPKTFDDFRALLDDDTIDAVVIAAPDHWHAIMTIMACQAGKDVYVEKPVAHNLLEGERMIEAARKFGRIVQTGLQQRSGTHFQSAVDLIQSGRIGNVRLARAWAVHRRKSIGTRADSNTPQDVNYDLWLGPAPSQPFNTNRFHHNWHWHWDYGTGELGNWGVHLLDVARWGLGLGLPARIAATGGNYHFRDDQQTPDTQLVTYTYPEHIITWEHRQWSTHAPEGRSAAVAFHGDQGTLVVDRGGWKVYDSREKLSAESTDLLRPHLRNFIECIRTRRQPSADLTIGHASTALCHLGNVAYRLGREIQFDATAARCIEDKAANELLARTYRDDWPLPVV